MHATRHIQQRMSQRGVTRDLVDLVMTYGRQDQDKYVMGRREAQKHLEALQNETRLVKKVLDKGGVVVVADGDALITTYNFDSRRR